MTAYPIVAPKKLIEVALPLDVVNFEAARSKRKAPSGYPTTLHCWWAQRPISAARAVLFAQLVNDPSWKYSDVELKKPQIKSAITRKRNDLFRLIGELVPWASATSETVLSRARAEILASWRETCEANRNHPHADTLFNPEAPPQFHDPFAGAGSLPLEAQRLGLEAHASDLNPVAVLINKAMIEIPPKFAGRAPVGPIPRSEKQAKAKATQVWSGALGLAEDVRRYGAWMRDQAEQRIGDLYPKVEVTKEMAKDRPDLKPLVAQKLTVVAWLWARTVKSPNPAHAEIDVPLASSFVFSSKPGKEVWVEPIREKGTYRFALRAGKPPAAARNGTKASGRGADFFCVMSNSPITPDYIKGEGRAGRMGVRLMAVVAEGTRGRIYLAATPEQEKVALSASPKWRPDVAFMPQALGFRIGNYGLTSWSDLFTSRQLVALGTFSDLVQLARDRVREDAIEAGMLDDGIGLDGGGGGASAYADALAVYLAFAVDRVADYGSALATWRPKDNAMRATLSKHAIPMNWDFAEGSPFGSSSSGLVEAARVVARVLEFLPASGKGLAVQGDAQSGSSRGGLAISTDPPYYDNIGYADLSDFFYVWLRRSLRNVFPSLFATIAVPKDEELVATPHRHGGKQQADAFFLEGMTAALRRLGAQTDQTTPITIYYAFKQSETEGEGTASTGWETFLEAVLRADLTVTGTWPVRTEGDNRQRGNDSNALASSIVLVCRPRPQDASSLARRDFLRLLDRALPAALAEMTADPDASVAPADLPQAVIGPGMAIFSKHKAVLEADGKPMTVHNALVHVNKAVDTYFGHAEDELDSDTRFCIEWLKLFGFTEGPFGQADGIARAKGTAVAGVVEAGVLSATKGKVRLLRIKEYPKRWDPTTDSRVPVWEACHHMCRALGDSEKHAGELLARMPDKQDAIRQLAYRLYTICERQKWAEEARAYNELITSWPAIVEQSVKAGHRGEQLDLL